MTRVHRVTMKVTTATTSPAVLLGRTLMIYCRSSVKKSICSLLFYGHKKTTLAVAGISVVLAGHDHVTLSFVIQQVTADLAVRF
ncbi:MAG: hypothetical protein M3Z93_08500 [Commensalibacter sp.]|nr:hypothetical protein [Commensalibacter sp.]